MVQVIAQTYRKNVLLRKKTGQNISQNMRYRKETSDPTKCCSPIIFTDNICLKGDEKCEFFTFPVMDFNQWK